METEEKEELGLKIYLITDNANVIQLEIVSKDLRINEEGKTIEIMYVKEKNKQFNQ